MRMRQKNETLEEAIDGFVKRTGDRTRTVHGVRYRSLRAVAKAYGVTHAALQGRLRSGASIEAAIDALLKLAPKGDVTAHGKKYPSLTAAASAHGVYKSSVIHRMSVRGENRRSGDRRVGKARPTDWRRAPAQNSCGNKRRDNGKPDVND